MCTYFQNAFNGCNTDQCHWQVFDFGIIFDHIEVGDLYSGYVFIQQKCGSCHIQHFIPTAQSNKTNKANKLIITYIGAYNLTN